MLNQPLKTAVHDERGQGLVEYALIIALVSLAAVASLGFLSGKINTLFSKAGNSLNAVVVAAPGSGAVTPPPDTTSPALTIAAPANGATNVGMNPTYSGTCGTAAGDLATITINVERVAGNPDNQSPYGPFTTTCSAGGTWSLTQPGGGASQGLKNNRTYLATITQSDSAGNTATVTSQFTA